MLRWTVFAIHTRFLLSHLPYKFWSSQAFGQSHTSMAINEGQSYWKWYETVWCNGSYKGLHLGFVHPLQDVALHQCLPLSSVFCSPNSGGSLLLYYVVLPSSAWLSSWSLPYPWLPLCAAFGPPIVLHFYYMTGPFPLLFQCVFYDINYFCSFPDFWAWYLIL